MSDEDKEESDMGDVVEKKEPGKKKPKHKSEEESKSTETKDDENQEDDAPPSDNANMQTDAEEQSLEGEGKKTKEQLSQDQRDQRKMLK